MSNKSVIFSQTMEVKFLSLAAKEKVIVIPENHSHLRQQVTTEKLSRDEISQIQANIFLNPYIKLPFSYECEFEPAIDNLFIEMQKSVDNQKEFEDAPLLWALVLARNPSFDTEAVPDAFEKTVDLRAKLVKSFGDMPTRRNDGNLITLRQTFAMAVTRQSPPTATQEQQRLFSEYEKYLSKIQPIMDAYHELQALHERTSVGDSVVIDPRLRKNFADFIHEKSSNEDQFNETDTFYLFIKELGVLPVGRNIKETIELANTKEGDSLRKRVGEVHDSIISGELKNIEVIREKIKDDIHEYKLLTSRLRSPNLLNELTDLALSATSLVPVAGTFIGAVGLKRTIINTMQKRSAYEKIKQNIWVDYRGKSF